MEVEDIFKETAQAQDFSGFNGVWITWEEHRRTRELAEVFGVSLHELIFSGPFFLRVVILAFRTLRILYSTKPEVLIVQNPSVVLASWVCFLHPFFNYYLVVDRHSNFKLDKAKSRNIKYQLFHMLSRYSIRHADLTIVTNKPLQDLLEDWGGKGFVMPDRFPKLELARRKSLGPGRHVLYICSFDKDEPVDEVIGAAHVLGDDVAIHVTGNSRKAKKGLVENAPKNVEFTGFLPEEAYQSLLVSSDVILTLTTMPHTMQCGAYEAVAAFCPLVFGPDPAMVQFFHMGRVVTDLNSSSIASSLLEALANRDQLSEESKSLFMERGEWWDNNFKHFVERVFDDSKLNL